MRLFTIIKTCHKKKTPQEGFMVKTPPFPVFPFATLISSLVDFTYHCISEISPRLLFLLAPS